MITVAQPAPAVVLFDIDGTLLRRAGPHHRQSLEDAVLHVTGVETTTSNIATQGMLDGDILKRMMRDAGMKPQDIAAAMPSIMTTAEECYQQLCPDLRSKVCPGVRPFLQKLKKRGVISGLVTGNLTRIGWCKMENAGIRQHFQFGAFADQGHTRAALVRIALRHARTSGWLVRKTPVVLIGDHPNDVNAAKKNGVRAVAVSTGLSSKEELLAHSPRWLVDDLTQLNVEELFSI